MKRFRELKGDTLRYLISGGCVTIAGTLLLTALLHVFAYSVAFTIVFLVSISANAFLHSVFVFRKSVKGKVPLVIASLFLQYAIGIGCLHLLIDIIHVPRNYAAICNLFICTPINFLISRTVFRSSNHGETDAIYI